MLPYTLRNQPTPGAKRTLPPLCADVGLMTFGMRAVRIWVFCACMGRLAEVMQVWLACPGERVVWLVRRPPDRCWRSPGQPNGCLDAST
jgi:hypothetical protein